jgi:transposase
MALPLFNMEKQTVLPIEPKHSQNWAKYNLAKCNEKLLFIELLHDLSKIIKEPTYQFGRPAIPIKDMFFSCGLKLYSNYSGRKVMSDLTKAEEAQYISKRPHFNSIKDFLNCPATYDLLLKLLTISAMPLRKLEDKYSIDSSGFGSYQYERWQRVKWDKKKDKKNYLKGHIVIGTRTNIVCGCDITPGNFSDARQAPEIIYRTGLNFRMKEFTGDKAYSSKLIFRILESLKCMPYIPFKHNSREPSKDSPEIWNKMFLYFRDNKEEFMKHYHKRSNVETTFAMIKLRLGEHLKSKNYHSQRNELMMKFICHNICCLIQEMYEHNVAIDFRKCLKIYVERKVPDELLGKDSGEVQNEDF